MYNTEISLDSLKYILRVYIATLEILEGKNNVNMINYELIEYELSYCYTYCRYLKHATQAYSKITKGIYIFYYTKIV